ncbi:MAG: hypothetical protein RXO36_05280 [Candidatus Nanopusillus acidilobi]
MDENEFKQALETILDDLKIKLENSKGIAVFVNKRDKFEGWLKVEIVDILYNKITKNVTPEASDNNKNITSEENKNYQHIDIVFDDSALELKTINTNYRCNGVENKTRPIVLNVKQLKKDIDKLRELHIKDIKNKAILFVVFPLPDDKIDEFKEKHLQKLKIEIQNSKQFTTISGVPCWIYYGIV